MFNISLKVSSISSSLMLPDLSERQERPGLHRDMARSLTLTGGSHFPLDLMKETKHWS